MHVLAAPAAEDPRPDGFNHAVAGEMLYRSMVCETGREGNCGCERSWTGVSSGKATTLAEVIDRDMTERTYVRLLAAHLMDQWQTPLVDAEQEAKTLADLAADFPPGALLTIQLHDDRHVFEELET